MIDVINNNKKLNPKNIHIMVINKRMRSNLRIFLFFADFKSKMVQMIHRRFIFLKLNFLSLE